MKEILDSLIFINLSYKPASEVASAFAARFAILYSVGVKSEKDDWSGEVTVQVYKLYWGDFIITQEAVPKGPVTLSEL